MVRAFPAETTVLEDVYLLDPHLPGLSVKVRGRRVLEVKAYRGSPGLLEVAVRARGRLESWQKWSFPRGPARVSGRGSGEGPGCAVELTDVHAAGEAWWTLGFEATGPPDVLRGELDAAAALVFAPAPPGGLKLGMADSRSYAQWLRRQPRALLSPEPEGDPLADV